MQFLYPNLLFALSAAGIPVIIHLFRFRRYKKIIFSDVRFLKNALQETRSNKKIKEWLIMLCRMLAITMLVLAFAQPYLPGKENTNMAVSNQTVSIYIDNSFSSVLEGKEGIVLEEAKKRARGIVKSYGEKSRFQLLTADFLPYQSRTYTADETLTIIDDVQVSTNSRTLQEVVTKQKQTFENKDRNNCNAYVLSDFQKSFIAAPLPPDSSFNLYLSVVPTGKSSNISIDSAWIDEPIIQMGKPLQIHFRVSNFSADDIEDMPVSFVVNKTQKAVIPIRIPSYQHANFTYTYTPTDSNWQTCELKINDYPVTFDDHYYFCFKPQAFQRIVCINGSGNNPFIDAVFASDPAFQYQAFHQLQLNYGAFAQSDCIILNEAQNISNGLRDQLMEYIAQGGVLLIFPSAEEKNIPSLNELLRQLQLPELRQTSATEQRIKYLDTKNFLLRDVFTKIPDNMDMPMVKKYYTTQASAQNEGTSILNTQSGDALFYYAPKGKGFVVLSTMPMRLDWTGLPKHSLFIPLMLKTSFGSKKSFNAAYFVGSKQPVELLHQGWVTDKVIKLKNAKTEIACDLRSSNGLQSFYLPSEELQDGFYEVKDAMNTIQYIAINYGRKESDTRTYTESELEQQIPGTSKTIMTDNAETLSATLSQSLNGQQLWKLCVIIALFFVSIEILLLKL